MQTEDAELIVKSHFPAMQPHLMQQFPVYVLHKHHLVGGNKVPEEKNELVFVLNLKNRFQRSMEKFRDV